MFLCKVATNQTKVCGRVGNWYVDMRVDFGAIGYEDAASLTTRLKSDWTFSDYLGRV